MTAPTIPPVIVLTDCADPNAVARQSARIATLFGATPTVLPLSGADPEGTAALTLLDVLQSTAHTGGVANDLVVLVNIAPRDGEWPNGAPFCFFRTGRTLVVTTYNPRVLGPLRRHLGVATAAITDIREVLETAAASWAELTPTEIDLIVDTQFRSLWYLPLLARWLVDGRSVPARTTELPEPETDADATVRVAVVDNFGNLKLDRPAKELFDRVAVESATARRHAVITARDGQTHIVPVHDRLPDVPHGEPGLTAGSSGAAFAELVIRGGSAAEFFGFREGDIVFPADHAGLPGAPFDPPPATVPSVPPAVLNAVA